MESICSKHMSSYCYKYSHRKSRPTKRINTCVFISGALRVMNLMWKNFPFMDWKIHIRYFDAYLHPDISSVHRSLHTFNINFQNNDTSSRVVCGDVRKYEAIVAAETKANFPSPFIFSEV